MTNTTILLNDLISAESSLKKPLPRIKTELRIEFINTGSPQSLSLASSKDRKVLH
jgi:hypothetical protein